MNLYDMEEYDRAEENHRNRMTNDKYYKEEYLEKNSQIECPKCYTIQSKYDKFCSKCGKKLKK